MTKGVEHAIQCAIFDHYRILKTRGALLFAIPNGGARDISVGKALKDEGVTAGVPDMWGRAVGSGGFWLELKKKRSGAADARSDNQKKMHEALTHLGETVYTAYGLDEALTILRDNGVIR